MPRDAMQHSPASKPEKGPRKKYAYELLPEDKPPLCKLLVFLLRQKAAGSLM